MSDKLFAQCIKDQNSELLQHYINDGLLDLKVINIVIVLYSLDNLFWRESQDINLNFFECLLKNSIPLDSHLSKEHKATSIEKIIGDIENNSYAVGGAHDDDILKYPIYESILEKMLYLLVEYGANPNTILKYSSFGDNITLLEYAYSADKKLFRLLVQKDADINIEYISKSIDDLPQTPLSKAIDGQDIEIIKLLIEHNVKIDFWSYHKLFEKFQSYYLWNTVDKIRYNDLDSIKKSNFLLTKKIESFEDKTEKIKIDRKFDNLFEVLKLLLEYKMYINCTFRHKSIFDLAIEAGDYKTIEFFLENKIDELEKVEMIDTNNKIKNKSENLYDFAHSMIKQKDKRKLENLEEIRKHENNPYLKKDYEEQKNKPSVFKALSEKDIEQFKNTITKEIAEFLPVTDLIKEDYPIEFIEISIENGSDINFQDSDAKTVLILACEREKPSIVKYLLSKNIDLNIEDLNLKKAIQYVKDYELVKLFLVASKKQHNPKKLVKLLQNFTIDKPIKYTTHTWDFGELKKEYGDLDGYIKAVKEQFLSMRAELEELSPNLCKKIYTFLIDENQDKKYSWCSKTHINIGWSSLDGLKEWCDNGNKPENFELTTPISYEADFETVRIARFKDVIDLFKQEIEIRDNFKNLEKLFANYVDKLGESFMVDLSAAKLGRQFYTDTEKFSNVLDMIFSEIGTRKECPNIEIITTELEDRSIEIKITQIDSTSSRSAKELFDRADEGGDLSEIKKALINLCDWSIESSSRDEHFRVNFLHNNNVKDIEPLTTKQKGFTHILRFYK